MLLVSNNDERQKDTIFRKEHSIYWKTVCSTVAIVFLECPLKTCGGIFGCPNYWMALLSLSGQCPWILEHIHGLKNCSAVNTASASC